MGQDGEELFIILDEMEQFGNTKVEKIRLNNLSEECPKVYEYDRAIKAALLNWTSGVAQGLVKHRVEGGMDAWRKLYHKYMPLADDLQSILIRQLMSIKPVTENDMDLLFEGIERIRDLYIKVGSNDKIYQLRSSRTSL